VGEAGARAIAENLNNLHSLDLGDNNVGEAGARAIAENLNNLHSLDLGDNNVGDAGARAIAENLNNLHSLDLFENNVGEAGAGAIAENLTNLYTLVLGNNSVGAAGARAIAENLTNLHFLHLGSNNVGEAGARAIAENLNNLHTLHLYGCQLTDGSVSLLIEGLPKLQKITLALNESLRLPRELVDWNTDAAKLRDYFRRLKKEGRRKLNEAKLIIVGNEAVGKTALVNYLIRGEPCSDTDKTPGLQIEERIEVSRWETSRDGQTGEPLKLNVWDFGGQEVTRETHKLFLTARSLYMVVLEARRENAADAESVLHDWMRSIRHRGGESVPVIVVINKSEGDRELRLDETTLKKTYPIRAFIRTSCRDPKKHLDGGKGIPELRQSIIETIRKEIPQASAEFPVSYFEVKEKLREVAKQEHSFDLGRFTNICRDVQNPVTSDDEQRRLLELLVDIGVIIQHRGTTLLDPNWLTTAIYRILTHADVVKQSGRLRVDDLGRLLAAMQQQKDDAPTVVRYPQECWQYIIDQTVHCGLSFEIPDQPGTYLMPEQLSPNAIDTGLDRTDDANVLRFRYVYGDIPKGLFPRFIVQMHRYLTRVPTCWANGAVLYVGRCKVLVRSDRHARVVNIFVHGPQSERRESLRVVREGLEWVQRLFEEIGAVPMVPVSHPRNPEAAVAYSQLIDHERQGAGFERVLVEGVVFDVRELLGGIAPVSLPVTSRDEFSAMERTMGVQIHARDGATIQVTTGSQSRAAIHPQAAMSGASLPSVATSPTTWKQVAAPVLTVVVTASLVGMWIAGLDVKWMALLAIPTAAGAGAALAPVYFAAVRRNWARMYAGYSLTVAAACLLAPGAKFVFDIDPDSKIEAVLEHAGWPGAVALAAACYFGWLQWKKDGEAGRQRSQ
jgi:small GTP-binding protein